MQIDHKYTWVVPRNSWYIKLYVRVWEASPQDITFCKLFWAYTLLPLGILVKTVLTIGRTNGKATNTFRSSAAEFRKIRKTKARTQKTQVSLEEQTRLPIRIEHRRRIVAGKEFRIKAMQGQDRYHGYWVLNTDVRCGWITRGCFTNRGRCAFGCAVGLRFAQPGTYTISLYDHTPSLSFAKVLLTEEVEIIPPATAMIVLDKVVNLAAKMIMMVNPFRRIRNLLRRVPSGFLDKFYVGILALSGLAILTILGIKAYDLIASGAIETTAVFIADNAKYIGAGTLALAVGGVLFYLMFVLGVFVGLRALTAKTITVGAAGTRKTGLGFWKMMKLGYISVKTNTCPRVEIEE